MQYVPVIALTGHLGAGKTSVLNHVLRAPGARVGVVVNDFGAVNIDAGLVTGAVNEPSAITGGCLCCLEDIGALDEALDQLTRPQLGVDVVIVEASGLADPVTLARMIRFSGVARVRPGGVVDVIDASTHFDQVDRSTLPPARYAVTSLAVVNKLDLASRGARNEIVGRIQRRIAERNPRAHLVTTVGGRLDPTLLYDVASAEEPIDELPLRQLMLEARGPADGADGHAHADAVTVSSQDGVDAGRIVDLLERPPPGVYRLKGTVSLRWRSGWRSYSVNLVGSAIHLATSSHRWSRNDLVAIGPHLDVPEVRERMESALAPFDGPGTGPGMRRFQRYRRLSL